jgi:hypothetical protein
MPSQFRMEAMVKMMTIRTKQVVATMAEKSLFSCRFSSKVYDFSSLIGGLTWYLKFRLGSMAALLSEEKLTLDYRYVKHKKDI